MQESLADGAPVGVGERGADFCDELHQPYVDRHGGFEIGDHGVDQERPDVAADLLPIEIAQLVQQDAHVVVHRRDAVQDILAELVPVDRVELVEDGLAERDLRVEQRLHAGPHQGRRLVAHVAPIDRVERVDHPRERILGECFESRPDGVEPARDAAGLEAGGKIGRCLLSPARDAGAGLLQRRQEARQCLVEEAFDLVPILIDRDSASGEGGDQQAPRPEHAGQRDAERDQRGSDQADEGRQRDLFQQLSVGVYQVRDRLRPSARRPAGPRRRPRSWRSSPTCPARPSPCRLPGPGGQVRRYPELLHLRRAPRRGPRCPC